MDANRPVTSIDDLRRLYHYGRDYEFEEACYSLIYNNNTDVISKLIYEIPTITNIAWLLVMAVEANRISLVSQLVQAGARANVTDDVGTTPLMIAALEGYLPMAQLLVEAGANPNAVAEDVTSNIDWGCRGRSALFLAVREGHGEVAEFLAPLTDPWLRIRAELAVPDRPGPADEALDRAAVAGDLEAIRAALGAGANPRTRTGEGRRTALHAAADAGRADAVSLLLEAGAAVDARDGGGRTALWRGASRGHGLVVELLLRSGADPDARDFDYEQTPLIQAVTADEPGVVEALLSAGADPYASGVDGFSAFDYSDYQNVPGARAVLQRAFGIP
jgi:ankyrin repeat protein